MPRHLRIVPVLALLACTSTPHDPAQPDVPRVESTHAFEVDRPGPQPIPYAGIQPEPDDQSSHDEPDAQPPIGALVLPTWAQLPGDPDWDEAHAAIVDAHDDIQHMLFRVTAERAGLPPLADRCGTDTVAYRDGNAFASIEAATHAAAVSEIVLICPGTHAVGLELSASTASVFAPAAPGNVVLEPAARRRVISGSGVGTFALVDLSVQGASIPNSRGGVDVSGSDIVVVGCSFRNLDANSDGGALLAQGDRVIVAHNQFVGNHAWNESGALGVVAEDTVIFGNHFARNSARSGAGVSLRHSAWAVTYGIIVVAMNEFIDNTASHFAGGMSLGARGSSIHAVLIGNHWKENRAVDYGGAFNSSPEDGMISSYFELYEWNASETGAAFRIGGWHTATVRVVDVDATRNTGGDVFAFHSAGTPPIGRATFHGGTIHGNQTNDPAVGFNYRWEIRGMGVDFGTGTDANRTGDVNRCPPGLGAGADFAVGAVPASECG